MTLEKLFDLKKRIDPNAVRIPPGLQKLADAIEAECVAEAKRQAVPDGWRRIDCPHCGLDFEFRVEEYISSQPEGVDK